MNERHLSRSLIRPRQTMAGIALLLGILLGVGVAQGADRDEETTTSFQVQPGGTLRFDADVGDVNIITRDTSTLSVRLKRRVKATDPTEVDRLLEKLSIGRVQNGNEIRVTVRVEDDKEGRNRNKVELDFDITMPREFNVVLQTGGSASIGEIRGKVDAATSGGSLKLGDVSGAVTASSSGGSLQVGDVSAPLNARSSGGSIKAGRIAGPVVAHASGGSVLVAEARDAIDASAAGGSVAAYISNQPKSPCRLTASGGSVDLRLPSAAAVTVDASASPGEVSMDYEIAPRQTSGGRTTKGAINGGGPTVTLRATGGSVRLRKDSKSNSAAVRRTAQARHIAKADLKARN